MTKAHATPESRHRCLRLAQQGDTTGAGDAHYRLAVLHSRIATKPPEPTKPSDTAAAETSGSGGFGGFGQPCGSGGGGGGAQTEAQRDAAQV